MLLDIADGGGVGEVGVVPRRDRVQDRVNRTGTCWRRNGLIPLTRDVLLV